MKRHKTRGQSLVEFALISFTFVLLLVITIDFARVFSAYIMVGNMARAGAQYGSIANQLGYDDEGDKAAAEVAMEAAALAEQGDIFGGSAMAEATIDTDDSDAELCVARVDVEYDFEPLVTIPPIPETVTISRTAEMRGQILDLCL